MEFFKREYEFYNGEFLDDQLVPMSPDPEPWEYMFDGDLADEKKDSFIENEKKMAESLKKNKEIKVMLDDTIKRSHDILKRKYEEQSR